MWEITHCYYNALNTTPGTMLDLWYFFPSHLISAEHSTQIHTVKEKVTQDFTVWICVEYSAGIKWLGKKYQRSNIVTVNQGYTNPTVGYFFNISKCKYEYIKLLVGYQYPRFR